MMCQILFLGRSSCLGVGAAKHVVMYWHRKTDTQPSRRRVGSLSACCIGRLVRNTTPGVRQFMKTQAVTRLRAADARLSAQKPGHG